MKSSHPASPGNNHNVDMETANNVTKMDAMDKYVLWPLLGLLTVTTSVVYITEIATTSLSFYTSFIILAFMLGSAFASFIGAMIERLPKGESPNTPSHCACGRNLKPWENVPLIGWLSLRIANRGYTRCCQTKLPAWYFLFEAITGFTFAILAIFFIATDNFNPFILFSSGITVFIAVFLASDYRNTRSK